MIWIFLFNTSSDVFIPHNLFNRRRKSRRPKEEHILEISNDPCTGVPLICDIPTNTPCAHRQVDSHPLHPSHSNSVLHPAILLTCRTINAEASPFLYEKNTFQFEDQGIASSFRWSTNPILASQITSLHIVYGQVYLNDKYTDDSIRHYFTMRYLVAQWNDYLDPARPFHLGSDFPHLRNLTLTLGRVLKIAAETTLSRILGPWIRFFQRKPRLCLQIIGLNDETVLPSLTKIRLGNNDADLGHLQSPSEGFDASLGITEIAPDNTTSGVRSKAQVSEYDGQPGWKNVMLWWGDAASPPSQIRPFDGDTRWRRRLFPLPAASRDQSNPQLWIVGESYSERL